MSNQLLGTVYSRIMDDVIDNCHTTFEEEGVSPQTLEDLRQTWQKKLSALNVGSFPWEPPPAPQPMANPNPNPNLVPSNAPRTNMPPNGTLPSSNVQGNGEPRIKTEPGTENKIPTLPPNYVNNDARERAMAQLQEKFPGQTSAQLKQMQSQMLSSGQSQQNGGLMDAQRQQQAEYQRRQHAAQLQQMQRAQQQHPTNSGAPEGSTEWSNYVAERRTQAGENTQAADQSIRRQLEQRQAESGALTMPLAEQPEPPQAKRRKTDAGEGLPQLDGADDDDDADEDDKTNVKDELFDDDEDAINSDLDDPDDNEIEQEPDDGKPTQVMLCTYDKVQRVKNKWKCTLRDGVLNSGGKEYVFGKANGEFEW